ncbi:MAG: BrnT family toxin, partial [Thermomicrobiales bacterium]
MEFEWDPAKDASNRAKHGLGFGEIVVIFADQETTIVDLTEPEHGETRFKAIGHYGDQIVAVIFTMRAGMCRIISARSSSRNERKEPRQGEAIARWY